MDLFENTTDSLAHCVSQCFTMGKGIAVQFKKRFGCVSQLKAQNATVGNVAVLHLPDGRWIYYLVTKERYNGKPTYETMRASLCACRDHALEHGVKCIAMPKIGCGLDKLDWRIVGPMITDVFEDTGVEIKIYSL